MKKIRLIIGLCMAFFMTISCETQQLTNTETLTPVQETMLKNTNLKEKITGFDQYGYNWNAHLFKGNFYNAIVGDNLYAFTPWSHGTPYTGNDEEITFPEPDAPLIELWQMAWYLRDVHLLMRWNDALISGEGVYPPSLDDWIGSDAWITFQFSGIDENGKNWSQYQKMVAANQDDELIDGIWYDKDHEEIGIFNDWTQLILVQVVKTGEPPFPFSNIPSYLNTKRLGFGETKK